MTPYSWDTLAWAGGLVVGVVATPRVLLFLYWAIVLSTWHHTGTIFDGSAENRLWWLGQFIKTITLPYGLLVIAAVFGWRLSMGNYVPLPWRWCLVIIVACTLMALIASGGIPAEPEMPQLQQIPVTRSWAFLMSGIAVMLFFAAHFAHLKWLHILVFVAVFFVVAFWAAHAARGSARLFLRADHGQSTSYPLD